MYIRGLPLSAGSDITIGTSTIVGGTQGSVLFVGAGSVIQQDNANFFWDDTSNFLGIGTAAAPVSPLHVAGSISPAASADAAITTIAGTIVEAGSGAHALLAGLSITAPTITAGVATVTNTASLYVAGAPSATVTGANYAVWVDAGNVRTDGVILASDGSASAPSYTFQTNTDTGMFISGSTLAFTVDNNTVFAQLAVVNDGLGALSRLILGAGTAYIRVSNNEQLFLMGGRGTSGSGAEVIICSNNTRTAGVLFEVNRANSTTSQVFYVQWNGGIEIDQVASTSGAPEEMIDLTGAAHTGLTASTEAFDVRWDLSRTVEFATGALTTQRAVYLDAPTYAFVGASTLTNPVTVDIGSSPAAGANATLTSPRALRVGADAVTIGPTSAGLNYATVGLPSHTVTVTGSTQVTAAVGASLLNLGTLTITDASAVTIDVAAALYIAAAPVAAGSVTITDSYAIFVDAGNVRIDAQIFGGLGSVTAPTYSFTSGAAQDDNTGFYSTAADNIDAATGGTRRFNIDTTQGAATTPIQIDVNGGMQRVTIGANDSGGAGFRVLRVPN